MTAVKSVKKNIKSCTNKISNKLTNSVTVCKLSLIINCSIKRVSSQLSNRAQNEDSIRV